eukprot:1143517-Pelagomonas_calceolata.AAC.6
MVQAETFVNVLKRGGRLALVLMRLWTADAGPKEHKQEKEEVKDAHTEERDAHTVQKSHKSIFDRIRLVGLLRPKRKEEQVSVTTLSSSVCGFAAAVRP